MKAAVVREIPGESNLAAAHCVPNSSKATP
jgi:hypothetical protein